MAMMNSTTERATTVARSNKRGLLVMAGGAIVAISFAMMSGTNWMPAAPAAQVQVQKRATSDTLAVGATFTFAQSFGDVVLTVRSVDGDMVTVADAEGDIMTVSAETLTGGTLPASNADSNALRMMEVVEQRAASGYYSRHAGQNGAWGD